MMLILISWMEFHRLELVKCFSVDRASRKALKDVLQMVMVLVISVVKSGRPASEDAHRKRLTCSAEFFGLAGRCLGCLISEAQDLR